ncbi:uncharacterized protein LOC118921346 isoform X1 [Manis pentadactyla]|uniref:uncharacterized protein LOC118921346 isoform X1 n=1 Tax=Manis pentadactyla TaxID=143292 RepID=UPI00255CE415|nr:uncharacterized protein LOC118921346 isoform X1 [Manis pentadactyla]
MWPRAWLGPRQPPRDNRAGAAHRPQRVGPPVPRRRLRQGLRDPGREAAPAAAEVRRSVQSGPRFRGEGDSDGSVDQKEDFDVDHFVSGGRKHVQLEELRDDLELDDELLKTAMVGLINKDYADFVNLSTNLVGMDKALNQLPAPLGQLREEVLATFDWTDFAENCHRI